MMMSPLFHLTCDRVLRLVMVGRLHLGPGLCDYYKASAMRF
jgi:hypothetical protein